MKLFYSLAFFILCNVISLALHAQQPTKLTGTVKDEKQTLPSATVLLYQAKDSSLVSSAMTDQDGKFTLAAKKGSYYIQASSVGYGQVKSATFIINAQASFIVPDIKLKEDARQLGQVNITASKPVLERKADKLIFNVDVTPSAAGLTALEVLKKAPGVIVDYNEQISLAGKANVLVMIDGKQTYLSGTEVSNLLKSMQSNEIESIEVISNPGSRYEANSTGGIINIKTKKSKALGFNGSVALGGGFNKFLNLNNSANLNYRQKAFNLFGSYGHNRNKYEEHLTIDRVTPGSSNQTYFRQRGKDTSVYSAHNFKAGADFFLSKNHTIGMLVKGNLGTNNGKAQSDIYIGDSFNETDSILVTPSYNSSKRDNFSYNINYKGILDTAGQELTIDADYSTFDGTNNANYVNRFFRPDGSFFKDGQIYRNFAPSNIEIKAIKGDYTLPLGKTLKLDAGVKMADVKTDNNYVFENSINGNWEYDTNRSNHFTYDERVNAVYASMQLTLKEFTIQAGLRAEHTKSTGNSITSNQITKRDYTNLFPTLFASKSFDADNVLNFSYSRKINRPNYQNLNPFIFYLDQYTYNQGNPNLQPEYANNFELSYLFKQKYSLSLSYNHTSDVITQVLLQNLELKSMYQTVLNLSSSEVAAVTLNFPVTISKWWSMNNNILGYYKRIKSPDLTGSELNAEQVSANIFLQNNFKMSSLLSADAGISFSTPQIDGAFRLKTLFGTDLGLRYNFPNKLGNLKLGITDVFHTQRARITSTLPNNTYNLEQWGTTTSARLTFTYQFGKSTVKSARTRSTGLDEEQKRLGNK